MLIPSNRWSASNNPTGKSGIYYADVNNSLRGVLLMDPGGTLPATPNRACRRRFAFLLQSTHSAVNFDGNPAYNPLTDTDPLSNNTDADAYLDNVGPAPLNFNFDDGGLAPWGALDSRLNVADMLVCMQTVLDLKVPTNLDLAYADLYPVGAPDGIIDLSDHLQLNTLVFSQ